jgi:DNA polymerase-3 subunit delta'
MHHAWMLAGPPGRGKSAFAKAAASELVGGDSAAREDFHPDILHLQREPKEESKASGGKPAELRRNITIAQIRALQRRLTTRPTAGAKRAVIIDPVDDLEQGACNALLKSLEEPPEGTVFLLVAHHPAKVLPTIRSRCRFLRFAQVQGGAPANNGDDRLGQAIEALMSAKNGPDQALQLFTAALGSRPSRTRLQEAIGLAQTTMAARIGHMSGRSFKRIDRVYAELGVLDGELASYNYDADLIGFRIGTLLTGLGASIDGDDA